MRRINSSYLRSNTFRNFAKLSLGKITNAGFVFIVNILVARNLEKSDFGLFMLSLSVLIITLELIGSEAADNGLVRFAAKYLKTDVKKSLAVFRIVFKFKALNSVILILICLLLFKPMTIILSNKPNFSETIIFGIIGGCIASMWRYTLAVLQSHERFSSYAIITIIPNALKLIIIAFLILLVNLTLHLALMINVITLIIGFVAGYLLISKRMSSSANSMPSLSTDIYHFAKWIYLTNLIFAVYSRLDMFLLTYFVDGKLVGIYSAAFSIVAIFDLLYVSLLTIFFPIASQITQPQAFKDYLRKSIRISILLSLIISPIILLAEPIIVFTYSAEYIDSVPVLRILLIGVVFTLLFNPFMLVLYARNNPRILTFIYMTLLSIHFISSIIWIPRFGVIGAATVVSITRLLGALLIAYFAVKEVNRFGNTINGRLLESKS